MVRNNRSIKNLIGSLLTTTALLPVGISALSLIAAPDKAVADYTLSTEGEFDADHLSKAGQILTLGAEGEEGRAGAFDLSQLDSDIINRIEQVKIRYGDWTFTSYSELEKVGTEEAITNARVYWEKLITNDQVDRNDRVDLENHTFLIGDKMKTTVTVAPGSDIGNGDLLFGSLSDTSNVKLRIAASLYGPSKLGGGNDMLELTTTSLLSDVFDAGGGNNVVTLVEQKGVDKVGYINATNLANFNAVVVSSGVWLYTGSNDLNWRLNTSKPFKIADGATFGKISGGVHKGSLIGNNEKNVVFINGNFIAKTLSLFGGNDYLKLSESGSLDVSDAILLGDGKDIFALTAGNFGQITKNTVIDAGSGNDVLLIYFMQPDNENDYIPFSLQELDPQKYRSFEGIAFFTTPNAEEESSVNLELTSESLDVDMSEVSDDVTPLTGTADSASLLDISLDNIRNVRIAKNSIIKMDGRSLARSISGNFENFEVQGTLFGDVRFTNENLSNFILGTTGEYRGRVSSNPTTLLNLVLGAESDSLASTGSFNLTTIDGDDSDNLAIVREGSHFNHFDITSGTWTLSGSSELSNIQDHKIRLRSADQAKLVIAEGTVLGAEGSKQDIITMHPESPNSHREIALLGRLNGNIQYGLGADIFYLGTKASVYGFVNANANAELSGDILNLGYEDQSPSSYGFFDLSDIRDSNPEGKYRGFENFNVNKGHWKFSGRANKVWNLSSGTTFELLEDAILGDESTLNEGGNNSAKILIQGSEGDDNVIIAGTLNGKSRLGGGDDRLELTTTSELNDAFDAGGGHNVVTLMEVEQEGVRERGNINADYLVNFNSVVVSSGFWSYIGSNDLNWSLNTSTPFLITDGATFGSKSDSVHKGSLIGNESNSTVYINGNFVAKTLDLAGGNDRLVLSESGSLDVGDTILLGDGNDTFIQTAGNFGQIAKNTVINAGSGDDSLYINFLPADDENDYIPFLLQELDAQRYRNFDKIVLSNTSYTNLGRIELTSESLGVGMSEVGDAITPAPLTGTAESPSLLNISLDSFRDVRIAKNSIINLGKLNLAKSISGNFENFEIQGTLFGNVHYTSKNPSNFILGTTGKFKGRVSSNPTTLLNLVLAAQSDSVENTGSFDLTTIDGDSDMLPIVKQGNNFNHFDIISGTWTLSGSSELSNIQDGKIRLGSNNLAKLVIAEGTVLGAEEGSPVDIITMHPENADLPREIALLGTINGNIQYGSAADIFYLGTKASVHGFVKADAEANANAGANAESSGDILNLGYEGQSPSSYGFFDLSDISDSNSEGKYQGFENFNVNKGHWKFSGSANKVWNLSPGTTFELLDGATLGYEPTADEGGNNSAKFLIQGSEGGDNVIIAGTLNGNINLSGGDNTFSIQEGGSLEGNISSGDGNDHITLSGVMVGIIDLAEGDDVVVIKDTATINSVINFGAGDDILQINMNADNSSFANISSNAAFDGGKGIDSVHLEKVFGDSYGSGDQGVSVFNMSILDGFEKGLVGKGDWELQGDSSITWRLAEGAILTIGENANIHKEDPNDIAIQGSEGNDHITLSGVMVGSIDLADGNNKLSISNLLQGDIDSGDGDDNITLSGVMVGNIDLAGGNNVVSITNRLQGDIGSGDGDDHITLSGVMVGIIDLNSGDDVVVIKDTATINSVINFGAGDDILQINMNADNSSFANISSNAAFDGGDSDNDILRYKYNLVDNDHPNSVLDVGTIDPTYYRNFEILEIYGSQSTESQRVAVTVTENTGLLGDDDDIGPARLVTKDVSILKIETIINAAEGTNAITTTGDLSAIQISSKVRGNVNIQSTNEVVDFELDRDSDYKGTISSGSSKVRLLLGLKDGNEGYSNEEFHFDLSRLNNIANDSDTITELIIQNGSVILDGSTDLSKIASGKIILNPISNAFLEIKSGASINRPGHDVIVASDLEAEETQSVTFSGSVRGNTLLGNGDDEYSQGTGAHIDGFIDAGEGNSDTLNLTQSNELSEEIGRFNLSEIGAAETYRGFEDYNILSSNWIFSGTGSNSWNMVGVSTLTLAEASSIAVDPSEVAILGDEYSNELIIKGSITGDINLAEGDDILKITGKLTGNVDLGQGNDALGLNISSNYTGNTIDGGEGEDEFNLIGSSNDASFKFDLASISSSGKIINFETLNITGGTTKLSGSSSGSKIKNINLLSGSTLLVDTPVAIEGNFNARISSKIDVVISSDTTKSGKITTSGTYNISSGVSLNVISNIERNKLKKGDKFTILEGGVGDNIFSDVEFSSASVLYDLGLDKSVANIVSVEVTNLITPKEILAKITSDHDVVSQTINQASNLLNFVNDASAKFSEMFFSSKMSDASRTKVLNELAPVEFHETSSALNSISNQRVSLLSQRTSTRLNQPKTSISELFGKDILVASNNLDDLTYLSEEAASDFSIWGLGSYNISSASTTSKNAGFSSSAFGFSLGGDYKFVDGSLIGAGINYLNTSIKGKDADLGKTQEISSYLFSVYGGTSFADTGIGTLDLDASLAYGINSHNTVRSVNLGAASQTLRGNFKSSILSAYVGVSLPAELDDGLIGSPKLSANWTNTSVDSYTETGGVAALSVDSVSYSSFVVSGGYGLSKTISTGTDEYDSGSIEFYGSYDLEVELGSLHPEQTSRFVVGGEGIVSKDESRTALSHVAAAGLNWNNNQGLVAGAGYKGRFSGEYSDHSILLNVRYSF